MLYSRGMADLIALIQEKQQRLAECESEAAQLRAELQQAKQLLLEGVHGVILGTGTVIGPMASSTDMAESVLRRIAHPLHVNEIISGIERDFHVAVRYATLVGNISRLVKRRKIFERTGPNR